LDNSADKGLKNANGETPFDWIELRENDKLKNSIDEVKKLLAL
jgi:hypothetical protein